MIDANKWAEAVEGQRRDVAEMKEREQTAFNNRREIFKDEAPKLWPAIRATFTTFCDAYNKKRDILFCADIGVDNFIVRRKDLPNVLLDVTRLAGHKLYIKSSIGYFEEMYEPQVFENGHGSVSYVGIGGHPITAEEIVAAALGPIAQI